MTERHQQSSAGNVDDAGDAATLRGFIKTYDMTPSMMASDRDRWHRVAMEAGAITCQGGGHIYPLRDEVKKLRAEVERLTSTEPQTSGVWLPIETAPEDLQEYAAKRSRNIPRGDVVQLGGSLADGTLFLFGHDALTHKAKQWMKIPPLQSPSPLSRPNRESGK